MKFHCISKYIGVALSIYSLQSIAVTLEPTTLSFNQGDAAKSVKLSSMGEKSGFTFSVDPTISGTDASSFTIEASSTCKKDLSLTTDDTPANSCIINVKFNPLTSCPTAGCTAQLKIDDSTTVALTGASSSVVTPPTCTTGQTLVNGVCVATPPTCATGQTLVNGACVTTPPTCTTGQTLVNGVCVATPPTCATGETLVNGACITTGGLSKLESPLMISGGNNPQTATSTFFGGVSIDGQTSTNKMLDVTVGQTISVNGLIVPQHQGIAEIIAVGLYVPENSKRANGTPVTLPQTASKDYCDPELGDFYMNTSSVDYADNYCNWVVDRDGKIESTTRCNEDKTPRRSILTGSNVNDFWTEWGSKKYNPNGDGDKTPLALLKPMYTNVSLDSKGVSKLLYKDTVHYTGQVCIYFGYRLTDQTLVFNGEPIIFRVTSPSISK